MCESSLYYNKTILAPMVRVSSLGFRELCGTLGADLVFSEEIVAMKLSKCNRVVDTARGVIEYIHVTPYGRVAEQLCRRTIVFSVRINPAVRTILQLGTPNGAAAVPAALLVQGDVAGIDVNMGCPKSFSARQGMGIALALDRPRAVDTLKQLVEAVSVPVSCKTRLMPTNEASIELLCALAETGIHAITVHARTKEQRSSTPALLDRFREVCLAVKRRHPNLCIVLNGDVKGVACLETLRARTGCDAVMIARSAMADPTVFHRDYAVLSQQAGHKMEMLRCMFEWHVRGDTCFGNIKYHFTRIDADGIPPHMQHAIQEARTMQELGEIIGVPRTVVEDWLITYVDPLAIEKISAACPCPPASDAPVRHEQGENATDAPIVLHKSSEECRMQKRARSEEPHTHEQGRKAGEEKARKTMCTAM